MADKSQIKYLKYTLGVNKYSSNLAVLSETGRLPMYFSVIISILKYLFRLENASEGLLKEAYTLSKSLYHEGIHSWYTSALHILQLLDLNISSCINLNLSQLVNIVKGKLINKYKSFWNQERERSLVSGKLDTYFSIKRNFTMEPYLLLNDFHLRKAICKLRISAHNLLIESGRYAKSKSIPRSERICKNCNLNLLENEIHFLTQCTLYDSERAEFYKKVSDFNTNFALLNDDDKAMWLLLQENKDILSGLASFIVNCFDKRNNFKKHIK